MVATYSKRKAPVQGTRLESSPSDRASTSRQEAIEDAELVRRFNSGDEAAFDQIVSRYRGRMYAIAHSHLRNHGDAEEIAQDAFIRAYRGLANFRGNSSLATWLQRIATNLSRNRYWYFFCRRRHVTLSLDRAFSDDNTASFSDMIACDAPGPAREVTTDEFSTLVNECMGKLGDPQREILMLRAVLNESYRDIAIELGISIGTVKSRIGRARRNLRQLMAHAYPEVAPDASSFDWFESIRPSSRVAVVST